jgi:hypothetical protein
MPSPLVGEGWMEGRFHDNSASSALACCKLAVSNPSVNQLYISARSFLPSSRLPWRCHRRLRLVAARSSNAFACWRRGT